MNTIGKDVFEQMHIPPEIKSINALVYNPINDTIIIYDEFSKNIVEYKIASDEFTILVEDDLINVTLIEFGMFN